MTSTTATTTTALPRNKRVRALPPVTLDELAFIENADSGLESIGESSESHEVVTAAAAATGPVTVGPMDGLPSAAAVVVMQMLLYADVLNLERVNRHWRRVSRARECYKYVRWHMSPVHGLVIFPGDRTALHHIQVNSPSAVRNICLAIHAFTVSVTDIGFIGDRDDNPGPDEIGRRCDVYAVLSSALEAGEMKHLHRLTIHHSIDDMPYALGRPLLRTIRVTAPQDRLVSAGSVNVSVLEDWGWESVDRARDAAWLRLQAEWCARMLDCISPAAVAAGPYGRRMTVTSSHIRLRDIQIGAGAALNLLKKITSVNSPLKRPCLPMHKRRRLA